MRSKRLRVVVALATVLSALVASSAAAPVDTPSVADEHRRVVEFWTHARVAQAVPRDFVLTPSGDFRPAAKPDRPPGKPDKPGDDPDDGGSTDSATTGSSWRGDGVVADSTGKVLFAFGNSYYVCSASAVEETSTSQSIVLTAAHCTYDHGAGAATNWVYIPNYDAAPAPLSSSNDSYCASTKHGCWTGVETFVHNGYTGAGGFNSQAVLYDFAFVTLAAGGKNGDLVEAVGTQKLAYIDVTTAYAFGYPAAQKYKGNDLVYCSGDVGSDPRMGGLTYRLPCGMTGGSSGGPWFATFDESTGVGDIGSLNSYGYDREKAMYGPVFNKDTQDLYDAAVLSGSPAGGS